MFQHKLRSSLQAIEATLPNSRTCEALSRPKAANRSVKGAKPDFFIVGAPRSGTTALDAYLAAHPEVFMAQKEMHCFGSDLRFGANFYRRDAREYLAEFGGWNGQVRIGESSVWYLFSTQAAAEIKAFNSDAQIIIMLREPVELLHSLYHVFRTDCNEQLKTFEEALSAQAERRAGRRISRRANFRQGLLYHEVPRYTEQVRRYFGCFGRERVHIIIYDDFAANPKKAFDGVLNFLGVEPWPHLDHFPVINDNHSPRSHLLRALLSDPLIRGSAISLRPLLPRVAFDALRKIETWLISANTRYQRRQQMDPGLCGRLKLEFTPEVERLSELIGRDLTHWSKIKPREAVPAVNSKLVSSLEGSPELVCELEGRTGSPGH